MSSRDNNHPLLDQLLEEKKLLNNLENGTKAYSSALNAYNETLEAFMIFSYHPLPDEYEISPGEMAESYVDFKESYIKNGPSRFKDFYTTVSFAAHVLVRSIGWRAESMRVEPLEVFRGSLAKRERIDIPNIWAMNNELFRRGQEALILGNVGASRMYIAGQLGHMPFVDKSNVRWVSSLLVDRTFWESFEPVLSDGACLLPWAGLRSFLLSQE